MFATNHALAGALIGVSVSQPLFAIGLAFISHFILDAVPHFGASLERELSLLKRVWLVDGALLVAGLICLLTLGVPDKLLLAACALSAMSPDLAWLYRYGFVQRFGKRPAPAMNWFNRLHARVQWSESHRGMVVELLFFGLAAGVLSELVL